MRVIRKVAKQFRFFARRGIDSCLFALLDIRCRVASVRSKAGQIPNGGNERGDVPGWVLVVLMTTGLVTAIWTIAAPRLSAILRNSLDSMNGIR